MCAYLLAVAQELGKKRWDEPWHPEDNRQPWSLASFFGSEFENAAASDGYSNILAAFLGLGELPDCPQPDAETIEAIKAALKRWGDESGRPLNHMQQWAARRALFRPFSIIKGPPGTGKTEVISAIVASALELGQSVAVVSANNEAIRNVVAKFEQAFSEGEVDSSKQGMAYQTALRMARLGSGSVRKKWKPIKEGRANFTFNGEKANNVPFADFVNPIDGYPFVACTVHSLNNCFKEGQKAKYDLLIMDESSQALPLLGAVALSSAHRAVIVGDEKQLAPIINSNFLKWSKKSLAPSGPLWDLVQDYDFLKEEEFRHLDITRRDYSFLESCYEVFDRERSERGKSDPDGELTKITTPLTEHYRCHPEIIGFCNKEIYHGQLVPQREPAPEEPKFPIGFRWYVGKFTERSYLETPKLGEDGQFQGSGHVSNVNPKQVTVFAKEEIPIIKRRLQTDSNTSVCILSPFKAQLDQIKILLEDELKDVEVKEDQLPGMGSSAKGAVVAPVKTLTIHKSQGKDFDLVYLLPVDDGVWEWPWSQGERLINVAVSRAKKELRVVASTQLMGEALQIQIAGFKTPTDKDLSREDLVFDGQLFIRRLADYVDSGGNIGEPEFGFVESKVKSIFDCTPFYQSQDSCSLLTSNFDFSAPESITVEMLARVAEAYGLRLICHVKFEDIVLNSGDEPKTLGQRAKAFSKKILADRRAKMDFMHFDALLVDARNNIILAVETDGKPHRYSSPRDGTPKLYPAKEVLLDTAKDEFITKELGGRIAHLGKDSLVSRLNHSIISQREDARAWLGLPKEDSSKGMPGHVATPEDLEEVSGPVLLRIPTDGSTFAETLELRKACGLEADAAPPTLEDYVGYCKENLDEDNCWKFVGGRLARKVLTDHREIPYNRDSFQALSGELKPLDENNPVEHLPTDKGENQGIYVTYAEVEKPEIFFTGRGVRFWLNELERKGILK
ncbi:DEAD/DEAH box helicase [Corynebacterium phocae]|uniref:DEAD/DEAH box helicase n=1 Tax=Corynebacterium phocae TaxID=161895 RepID=UPI0014711C2F|nr:AAA domain-containing protein [Corynebacterium phocae]